MEDTSLKKSLKTGKKPKNVVTSVKNKNSVLILTPIRSLVIRLKPRVPMVVLQLGLAILLVGIGTLSTSLHLLSSVPATLSQAAQIYGSGTIFSTSTVMTTLPPPIIIPKVNFSFPSNLTAVHPVTIQASAGTKMLAFIQSKNSGLETPLKNKSASPTTGTWVFEVDVQGLPAGEYRFLSRTYENYMWYDDTSNPFILQSTSVSNIPTETNQFGSSPAPATTTAGMTPTVAFGVMPAQLSGPQIIVLQVINVQSIKIAIKSSDGKIVDELSPSSISDSNFTFKFDTQKYPNGIYTFEAKFYTSTNIEYVPGPTIEFINASPNNPIVTTASTTTVYTTDVAPATTNFFSITNITNDIISRYQTFEFVGNDLTFVEVYTKSQAQTSPVFNGLAVKQLDQSWRYTIDVSTLPNGKYQVVAKYKHFETLTSHVGPTLIIDYGVLPTAVASPVAVPAPIQASVRQIIPVVEKAQATIMKVPLPISPTLEQALIDESISSIEQPVIKKPTIENNLDQIDNVINQYTTALRSGNHEDTVQAKNNALSLGVELSFNKSREGAGSDTSDISSYIEDLITRADRIQAMVKERTQDKISQDTDYDGITDYDEVVLYKTDPTLPDSDNDGFNDGAEILAGFNPVNSQAEVAVVYESPKDAGVTRPDILAVQSIVTINETVPKSDGVPAQAQISGIGLPNSFVTLFIFSTPVVVTLKTGDDGSWMYTFDKELEDGEHKVYVAVTDNAGIIVAKSNPFRFIKEAQAFTPADELASSFAEESAPRGIQSALWQTAIFGLIVFIVGLILILLGQQFERTRKSTILNKL